MSNVSESPVNGSILQVDEAQIRQGADFAQSQRTVFESARELFRVTGP